MTMRIENHAYFRVRWPVVGRSAYPFLRASPLNAQKDIAAPITTQRVTAPWMLRPFTPKSQSLKTDSGPHAERVGRIKS